MSETPQVDPDELQAQLDQIKDAMGIDERYAGATRQWLLFGVLVTVASGISQYVYRQHLPGYWFTVVWTVVLFGGGVVGLRLLFDGDRRPSLGTEAGKPSLWFVFGVIYLADVPIQVVADRFIPSLGYEAQIVFALSVILVLVGIAYLLIGNALRAYYIRSRDRYAFYAGGLLLIGLGVSIPYVDVLWTWGYAVFGGLYLVYALATYAVLTRT
ncbi:MAG: hypothetical protein ABEI57_04185 [Halapricum sp.]